MVRRWRWAAGWPGPGCASCCRGDGEYSQRSGRSAGQHGCAGGLVACPAPGSRCADAATLSRGRVDRSVGSPNPAGAHPGETTAPNCWHAARRSRQAWRSVSSWVSTWGTRLVTSLTSDRGVASIRWLPCAALSAVCAGPQTHFCSAVANIPNGTFPWRYRAIFAVPRSVGPPKTGANIYWNVALVVNREGHRVVGIALLSDYAAVIDTAADFLCGSRSMHKAAENPRHQ